MIRFDNVTYTYPFQTTPAVENISFSVQPGELVLCTGVSGCGKSTLMRLANGLCPHYYKGTLDGAVYVAGVPTTLRQLHELADDVGTLFQNPEEQFFALTVEDELVFAHEWRDRSAEEIDERLEGITHDFNLKSVLASSVHELSEGQKQKVGLASVLSQYPRAIILDEPTANLDPEATLELASSLDRLKKRGIAILVVDHRLYWLRHVADRVLVMERGRIAEKGSFALLEDDTLRARYGLRRAVVVDVRDSLPDTGNALPNGVTARLGVSGLSFAYPGKEPLFRNASCTLGVDVTAVIGDNGTGKTTLARLMTGLNKPEAGSFSLDGVLLTPDALLRKSSIVLQNADHQLYMRSVFEEVAMCIRMASGVPFSRKNSDDLDNAVRGLLERFGLESLAERHPQSLSGGEKQRLVIACAVAKEPTVLILDEPTSGLDGANMGRIAVALESCTARGACVLVITHDLELMAAVCTSALRLPLDAAGRTPHPAS